MEDFKAILAELKKPFLPEQHKERKLPGGGRWFFIPWQDIRERLDQVYPEWSCSWSEPAYLGDYCFITCTIIIAGVSRQAPGNAPLELISSNGKDMARGTPIERAIADAFKNAAEAFGVARYLDDQNLTAKLMRQQGDYRAYKFAKENEEIAAGARGVKKTIQPVKKTVPQVQLISEDEGKHLWKTARACGLNEQDVKKLLLEFNIFSIRNIPKNKYSEIMKKIESLSVATF